jgi:ABC-type arginine/histidine transport system permease subunit
MVTVVMAQLGSTGFIVVEAVEVVLMDIIQVAEPVAQAAADMVVFGGVAATYLCILKIILMKAPRLRRQLAVAEVEEHHGVVVPRGAQVVLEVQV